MDYLIIIVMIIMFVILTVSIIAAIVSEIIRFMLWSREVLDSDDLDEENSCCHCGENYEDWKMISNIPWRPANKRSRYKVRISYPL